MLQFIPEEDVTTDSCKTMTISDRDRINLEAIPVSTNEAPPPVNNACVPDIFSKLDASVIERTKVINANLRMKLDVQEKVLTKYRSAAERRYTREQDRIRSDLKNIVRRMPNYADIPHLETKVRKLKKRSRSNRGVIHNCVFTTEPKEIKGISAERDDKPFCDRFFLHHIPTKSKIYRSILPSVKKGMSMPDLRPRGGLPVYRLVPIQSRDIENEPGNDDVDFGGKRLPDIRALDDNFISSKTYLGDDHDDDTRTV